jgi:hypothetical protein
MQSKGVGHCRVAASLRLELIHADVEHGTIELAFAATQDFTHP